MKRLAIVGAGWAGLATAVAATRAGHAVTLFEAARSLGGRARTLTVDGPQGPLALDNGQHILIGAYSATLSLMTELGLDPRALLHAGPLRLLDPQGRGIALPAWPRPLDAAWGVISARGWSWRDKASLLAASARWQRAGFACPPGTTVADLGRGLRPRVQAELLEPLCVSALNTLPDEACGQVFLRVLRDSLFGPGWGGWGGAWLLIPRAPLGDLLPQAAGQWLVRHGAQVLTGRRVRALAAEGAGWRIDEDRFDAVVLAGGSVESVRLLEGVAGMDGVEAWRAQATALRHEAIATVYAEGGPPLPEPMLALPGGVAQFVFDRGQLGGQPGLLAFVVSASRGTREEIERQVLAQAAALGWSGLRPLRTVVEKRATFACTPNLRRPGLAIAPGLWACGDYVQGPYPATLEGAVRSGQAVITADVPPESNRPRPPADRCRGRS